MTAQKRKSTLLRANAKRSRRVRVQSRKKRRFRSDSNFKSIAYRLLKYLVVGGLIALIGIGMTSSTANWDSKRKLSIVYPRADGSVGVAVLDPDLDEVTVVIIPGETETTTAYQLGSWKVKSLWQLSINEDLEGELVSQTVTNHLKMPVDAWGDARFMDVFEEGDVFPPILLGNSNLTLKDKVNVGLFMLRLKNSGYTTTDLSGTTYLRLSDLSDGQSGYTVYGSMPQGLSAVFTANIFSSTEVTAVIIDGSDTFGLEDEVGEVLEVVGLKVAAVKKGSNANLHCIVRGNDESFVRRVSSLFECEVDSQAPSSSFDIEFEFGNEFVQRF